MTNAELLTSFKKYNKKAREIRAKRLGYQSAADYIAFLLGGGSVAPVDNAIPTIHIVDIADKSGSMEGGKDRATVEGINNGLRELIRNEQNVKYTHTYCNFASKINIEHIAKDPKDVSYIKIGTRDMTALWDAIGMTVKALEPYVKEGEKVLVNIYTDGQENCSREITADGLKAMIKTYSAKGWTFTFVGTPMDIDTVVNKVNILYSNTRSYDGTAQGMQASMQATNSARQNYVAKVKKNEDVSDDFYKEIGTLD